MALFGGSTYGTKSWYHLNRVPVRKSSLQLYLKIGSIEPTYHKPETLRSALLS